MKRIIAVLITFFLIIGAIFIAIGNTNINTEKTNKITVVTSLFPEYDFVKQIGKDKVDVKILLPPGTESHTYEPTPKDIVNINEADMFCYTSNEMEPWAEKIAGSIDSNTVIMQAGQGINLIEGKHNHEEENEEHTADAHIWLNPNNAIKMVENITDKLCVISPENAQYFKDNANAYIEEIRKLDTEIEETIANSKTKKLVFGGEFAYIYFLDRYNLEYATAYDGCGEGAEPSAKKIKEIIDTINNERIPVIFYEELSDGKIANMIADETNAKALVFHTAHNVTSSELENEVTYVSIMKENLDKIEEALK